MKYLCLSLIAVLFLFHQEVQAENSHAEAQEHYDKAERAFMEAWAHIAAAGVSIEALPIAIYEVYKSVEAFKEYGEEYSKGYQKEKNG